MKNGEFQGNYYRMTSRTMYCRLSSCSILNQRSKSSKLLLEKHERNKTTPDCNLLKCMLTTHNAFVKMSFGQMKTKFLLFSLFFFWSQSHQLYVYRGKYEAFRNKNTIPTVKHGEGSLMFLGLLCCAATGT